MFKNRIPLVITAIAALTFSSCAVDEKVDPNQVPMKGETVTIKFTTACKDTKTAFTGLDESSNSYPAVWTANDNTISMSMNFAEPVEASVNKETEENKNANFTATFVNAGGPYEFYALSPISAVNTLSASRESWTISVPVIQTPKADGLSCDEAAMILYAKSEAVNELPSSPIELQFAHVTTYCRLALKNLASAFESNNVADATIKSIDVTYSVPVAGSWYINAADGSIEEKEASYTITLKPSIEDLSQPTDLWFAMVPCTLDGETVKVSVNTDKGCLSREYTYGTRTYEAGAVNKLSLDMTKNSSFDEYTVATDEVVYELVTSLSDLNVDDEIIFVDAATPTYAMSATADGTSGLKSVSTGFTYSTDDNYIRLSEDSSVAVLTVASKSSSSFTFKNGSKYLTRTASGSSHYPSFGTSSFTFTVAISSGAASVSYKSGSGKTYYSLYYKTDHFTMYSSTSSTLKTMAIYKKTTVTVNTNADPSEDAILEQEQYGAYLSTGNSVHVPGTSQTSREFISNSTTFAILYPADNAALEFSGIPSAAAKGDNFQLVLTKINGRKKTVSTYDVSVIQEVGSKLWLSDMKGNGFIVKR